MLAGLFGGEAAEKVLLYLANYGEGYAKGIADTFSTHLFGIQKALLRLEAQGILVSRFSGKTKVFTWNPRFPLKTQLLHLLEGALELVPEEDIQKYFRKRTRPRKTGKPL